MLRKRKIESIFLKEWNAFATILENLGKGELHKNIHDARLHFKKMKSWLALCMADGQKAQWATRNPALQSVYKVIGETRNLFIASSILSSLPYETQPLTRKIQLKESALKLSLSNKTKELHGFLAAIHNEQSGHFTDLQEKDIQRFFSNKLEKLHRFFRKSDLSTAGLHDARKQLKTIYYAYKLMPGKSRKLVSVNTKYIKKLQDAIGKWNDIEITLHLLAPYSKQQITLTEHLLIRQNELFSKIKKQSRNFLRKATHD